MKYLNINTCENYLEKRYLFRILKINEKLTFFFEESNEFIWHHQKN